MNKKKTHEQYVQELKQINPNIEVVDVYVDNNTEILHRCKIHNIEWYIKPANALRGKSCRLCKGDKIKNSKRLSHDEYVVRLSATNPNVEIIEQYINANTPVMHRCKIHNIEWRVRPADVLRGKGCKQCHIEKFSKSKSKTHTEYVAELIRKNINIEVIDTYIKAKTPIMHKCKLCGYEWYAKPTNVLNGTGCPQCSISHGERSVSEWLINHSIAFETQKTFDRCRKVKLLPFDFYLPDYNVCIEYDGIQHFKPIEFFGGEQKLAEQQYNDNIKTQYCIDNNIILWRIKHNQDIEMELNKFFNDTKLIKEAI